MSRRCRGGLHIVHHQSEEYNLAVALRQGAFQPLFSWLFYLPLAALGFPPLVFLTCSSLNTLYQFWIHTRAIGKLGPFEWVFNTPSHHRVHHGCDDKYLDKNYAGTLIVWDSLFGSFQEEEEEPTYGITKPLKSWNPLWANVHFYSDLVATGRQAPNLAEKIKLWLAPPGYRPDWAAPAARQLSPLTHGEAGKYDAAAPPSLNAYVLLQFLGAVGLTVLLMFAGGKLAVVERFAVAGLIAWTVTDLGGIFDRKRWLLLSELLAAGGPVVFCHRRHGGHVDRDPGRGRRCRRPGRRRLRLHGCCVAAGASCNRIRGLRPCPRAELSVRSWRPGFRA